MGAVTTTLRYLTYGLTDPRPDRDGEVRYVGKSSSGLRRPREHAWLARKVGGVSYNYPVYHWIRKLQQLGLEYGIVTFDALESPSGLPELEQYRIAYGRMAGWRLLNITDGGEGTVGFVQSAAVREKHRVAACKVADDPAWRETNRAQNRKLAMDPAYRKKHHAAVCALADDPEWQVKQRTAVARPDVKVRQIDGTRAAQARPEVKEKRRAATCDRRLGHDTPASMYRRLIIEGFDNDAVHARVVEHFGADRAGPRRYVAWYRGALRRNERTTMLAADILARIGITASATKK